MPNDFAVRATRTTGKPVTWCYDTKRQAFNAFDKMKRTGELIDGGCGSVVSLMVFDGNDNILARWHKDHPQ